MIVEAQRSAADLAFLSAHDDDPFARYEAMQQLMLDTLLAAMAGRADHGAVVDAVRRGSWIGARAVQVPGDTEGLPTRCELDAAGLRS